MLGTLSDTSAEYTFSGFEITQTVAPEISTVVTAACARNAAARFARLYFGSRALEDDGPPAEAAETLVRPGRWPGVLEALRAPVRHLALVNRFAAAGVQERARASQGLRAHAEIPLVCDCPDPAELDPRAAAFRAAVTVGDGAEGTPPRLAEAWRRSPEAEPSPLLPCCFLSGAAVLAAQAARAAPGERVLDLCAGPGARVLVLASQLFGPAAPGPGSSALEAAGAEAGVLAAPRLAAPVESRGGCGGGLLVCNEPHRARSALLEGVLSSFLPEELLGKGGRVVATKLEASSRVAPGLRRHAPFDKVLVAPPCAAARALARCRGRAAEPDPAELQRSAELLRCAAALVRPGGTVVYATGSLRDEETDGAVRRFLRREGGGFDAEAGRDDSPIAGAERTALGTLVLPDQGTLHGPLYFARVRRL